MELLKVGQAAKQLALGKSTVYQLAARGEIPVVKIGGSVRIPSELLDQWIEQQTREPQAAEARR